MRVEKFTSQFPGFWKYTVVSPVLVFFALPAGVVGLHQPLLITALILFIAETISILMGIKLKMLFRLLKSSPALFLNGKNLSSMPVRWKREHSPFFVLLFAISFAPFDDAVAAYDITDSVRYERDWSRNEVGSTTADVVEASCDGCSISLAVENIIPADFQVMIDSNVGDDLEIDFSGKKPWGILLNELAQENGLHVELVRYKHLILISKANNKDAGISYVNLIGEKSNFYETKSFEVIAGDTLADTLIRWGNREEWNIVNQLKNNIVIRTPARFQGNLLEAVEDLINSFKVRGRLSRVEVSYSIANRTLLITPTEDK